ncbi:MAG: DUF1587 domain-containing protein, partial [Pirellulaceae bacterium]|nr:DUF1587 domain-containing protein [Pirellulaceae bacterium]
MRTSQRLTQRIVFVLLFSAGNLLAADRDFVLKVQPFLKTHCDRCHGTERAEGDVRVDQLNWDLDDLGSVDDLQNILDEIVVDSMPPEGEPRPAPPALKEITEVLSKHIADAKKKHSSGGGKPVRRLTKTEYVNTLYDLLGVRVDPEELPEDGVVGNFDTDATELYTTDMHIERCLEVARDAARRFIASRDSEPGRRQLQSVSASAKKGAFAISASKVPPAGFQIARLVCWQKDPKEAKQIFFGPSRKPIFEITGKPDAPQ